MHFTHGKNDRNHGKINWNHGQLNENYGKMMNTLGKSMNTMEKPTETMEKSMNSAAWQILAPKFNKVCRSLLQNVANWWWLVHLPWNRRPDKKSPGKPVPLGLPAPYAWKRLDDHSSEKNGIFSPQARLTRFHIQMSGFSGNIYRKLCFLFPHQI